MQITKLSVFDAATDLAPLEELQGELAAVRTRIERTDRLIDQVVYRLYGLTEDEIAVVEGTNSQPDGSSDLDYAIMQP